MGGVLCAFTGATFWGLSGVCADFLLSNYDISPLFITMCRALGAGVLFCCVIAVRYRDVLRRMMADARTVASLLIFGCLGLFPCQIVYLVAIDLTNAGTATVFQSLNIVFIALFTALIARKPLCRNEVLGVVCAFCSVFVIATQGNPLVLAMSLTSLLWCLFLGVVESFYVVYPEKLFQELGSFVPTGVAMMVSGFLSALVWLASSAWGGVVAALGSAGTVGTGALLQAAVSGIADALPTLDALGIVVLAVIAVVGTFASFALFLRGVSKVGAVTGSLMGAMEPLSAAILSALVLATPFTAWDWLGLVLMVATFFLVALKGGDKDAVNDVEDGAREKVVMAEIGSARESENVEEECPCPVR